MDPKAKESIQSRVVVSVSAKDHIGHAHLVSSTGEAIIGSKEGVL